MFQILPTSPEEAQSFLYQIKASDQVDMVAVENLLKASERRGVTPEMNERIRSHMEDGTTLTPAEQDHYDKVVKPLKDIYDKLVANRKLRDPSFAEGDEGVVPRIMKSSKDPVGDKWWDTSKTVPENLQNIKAKATKVLADLGEGNQGGLDPNITRKPDAAMKRGLYVFETKGGRRQIIQVEPDGSLTQWDGKRKTPFANRVQVQKAFGNIASGAKGQGGTIREAKVSELEKNTPYTYVKDITAVYAKRVMELRKEERAVQALDNLMKSPMWTDNAVQVKRGVAIPEGYKLLSDVGKAHELAGWAVRQELAEKIEDFARTNDPGIINGMSSLIIKNMMLNPIPHMFNEMAHWYLARGLSGWLSPEQIKSVTTSTKEAAGHVINMDKFYTDTIKKGGSLLSPDVQMSTLGNSLFRKGIDESLTNGSIKDFAAKSGRTVKSVYDRWSRASSKAMWMVRDTMYLQLIKEHMAKGLSHEEAIAQVDRHMPTYKLPSRVGSKILGAKLGRGLSKTLQNPNLACLLPLPSRCCKIHD